MSKNNINTILLLSNYPTFENPGYYIFIKHRTDALKEHYNVVVVSSELTSNKSTLEFREENGVVHVIIRINNNIPKLRSLALDYYTKRVMKEIISYYKPSLLEVHFSSYRSWIAMKLAMMHNLPYIVFEHASFFERKIKQPYFGSKIKKAVKNADKVIAVSQPLKNTMQKYVKRDIEVVPNIISTNKFQLTQYNSKNHIPQIVTVGTLSLDDNKGYFDLIYNLYVLKTKGYCFHCQIIGEGQNKEHLFEQRNQLGLEHQIDFVGSMPNDELVQLYNESDFFVSTSKIETFGVAIVEAMSCGLPIVATYSGGPETFIDRNIGVLAKHSSRDIADKLEYMLNNYTQYDPYQIRQKVIDNFSENIYLERMQRIYGELLAHT
ncbi:glycosyltransferase [Salibacterium aidingense]|uniref:glycosyltransferase n=1 Tax=Salibacterium aidingense TaxID=384933 RepID=UPI003BE97345